MLILSRFASFLVDYVFYFVLYYFFLKLGVLGFIITNIIFFIYKVVFCLAFGSTIGMKLLKLKLKNNTLKNCLKRELYRIASAFYYVGYIYAFFDKNKRCFHDIASNTYVTYDDEIEIEENKIIFVVINIVLILAIIKFSSNFLLNEIGLIGLKKVAASDEYFQSFDGDNLLSLSQDELYLKTLGRKYTAVLDINGKRELVRISNKLKYSEIYRLKLNGKKIYGEFLYSVNIPLQYISSVNFRGKHELLGISPKGEMVLLDENGKIIARKKINKFNMFMLKCGRLDSDIHDEAVVLDRSGNVEVYKYDNGIKLIYSGKIGEDIIPQCFYIDDGIYLVTRAGEKNIFYHYKFIGNKFVFEYKKDFSKNGINNIFKFGEDFIVSSIYRNNMSLKIGNIQRMEVYTKDLDKKYNFGNRKGRFYAFYVRNVEDVLDIDGDGTDEIILKAVGSDDVYGKGYIVEIYKITKIGSLINRILTFIT